MDSKRIVEFVNAPGYQPYKLIGLAKQLDIPKEDRKKLKAAIDRLTAKGKLRLDDRGLIHPGLGKSERIGFLQRTQRGSGFVRPNESRAEHASQEIYIASGDILDAFDGDEVLVTLLKRTRPNGQRCGRIKKVLTRRNTQFVGTYYVKRETGFVRVAGKVFPHAIPVGDPGAKGATPEKQVVIEMLRYPSRSDMGEAVITKVLGERSEPGVDTQMIIHEYGLPEEFPEAVLKECRAVADEFREVVPDDREDLTKEVTVTIDPVDARDFDDAISLKRMSNGNWELMVHIADVAHFVREGSKLDVEAKKRGTSVYLPGLVIPMLPELISNGLASLQEGRIRYVKTAIIEFSPEGTPLNTRLTNAAIKVNKRFAYEEVLPIVHEPERFKGNVTAKIRKLLKEMHTFAMMLRERRFRNGALSMDLPETKIDFNDDGVVSGAHVVGHDESHQMIEEFMLAANIAVATALDEKDILFLRRVHPDPQPNKLSDFKAFLDFLGYPMQSTGRPELQRILTETRGTPVEPAVNYALLRSFKQAQYSPEEQGHFALAEEQYCHFTSPIRRYPDLTVHRIIDRLVKKRRTKSPSPQDAFRLGHHCTSTEKRAEAAERELVKLKLLLFMKDHIGEEFPARITGVEAFGLFCRGQEIPAEGLLSIDQIEKADRFTFDAETKSLIGMRTDIEFRLGDPILLKVDRVDLNRRELDWSLVAADESSRRNRKTDSPKRSRPKRNTSRKPGQKAKGSTTTSKRKGGIKAKVKRKKKRR